MDFKKLRNSIIDLISIYNRECRLAENTIALKEIIKELEESMFLLRGSCEIITNDEALNEITKNFNEILKKDEELFGKSNPPKIGGLFPYDI